MLTVYGIETTNNYYCHDYCYKLQQCLPFTVLKQSLFLPYQIAFLELQQCLPFTVLKRIILLSRIQEFRCNSAYRLRYWNLRFSKNIKSGPTKLQQCLPFTVLKPNTHLSPLSWFRHSCNSAYRLRYWNFAFYFPAFKAEIFVATVLTVYGIETQQMVAKLNWIFQTVATVLTVYGIETLQSSWWFLLWI